tara:strand:+ start:60 stop:977 length:918 start_codon:yes stop_codon:yes gene_type:complete
MDYLLKPKILISTIVIFAIGILLGIFVPPFFSGNSSTNSIGDRLLLTGNPQTAGLNIPISTAGASADGWVDPMLCAPGRGRYFTKDDSANLVVLYNNAETVTGVYLRSDGEMPEPWKKTDALKGGGGIEIINQEHWGLYAFFNDPIKACQRPDAKSVGTGGTHYQGPKAVRSEYKPTPTPAPILGVPETIAKISESLSSSSKTFKVTNATDQSSIATGITSSQVAELLSSITDSQEGTGKWIENISHRGLTGNSNGIANILTSAKSDNLTVNLWINDNNEVNLIEIIGAITYEGSELTKLGISPE